MSNFEKMSMIMFVVIVAITLGITAFSTGMSETQEMLPSGQFIDYNYTQSFSDLNKSANAFSESVATTNPFGIIVYGLGTIGAIVNGLVRGLINVLTGYFDLAIYFADMIEPGFSWNGLGLPIGGIHILFSIIGIVMSIIVIYAMFVIARSILVK